MTQKFDEPDAEIPDGLWLMAYGLRVYFKSANDADERRRTGTSGSESAGELPLR